MEICCGGWLVHDSVTDEDKKVLAIALEGLAGCTFEPIAAATQVVNGVNYMYIAESETVTPNPQKGLVKIYVTATPAGQPPKLVNIETIITETERCGGWRIHIPVGQEYTDILATALRGRVGCTFEPLAVATQVINGMNYMYIAESTTVTAQPRKGLVKMYVAATPAGEPPKLINTEVII